MENFGIILSIPFFFVASIVYAFIIGKIVVRWNFLLTPLVWISRTILFLLIVEFLSVLILGVKNVRETIGQSYYSIHSIIFFLTIPSLVNVMKLQKKIPLISKWYIIGIVCAIFALSIILFQYYVSEALFGID